MKKNIDYFISHGSPWTYLGSVRFHEIAKQAGASINYRPASFHRIFSVSGGLPLGKRAPQRQRYRMAELARWRDYLGAPLTLEPKFFPAADQAGSQMVIAADLQGLDTGALSNAILRAIWAEERNIADDDTLVAIANEQGMDGAALLAASKTPEISETYDAYTQEAIDRHVFGAPTYIYNGELYWGQDRLGFLERALAG
ncbi:MAG: 2-hydroxychromene-2-carboxylate isomerase [Alphaproteobacteria bacterium]